MGPVAPEGVFDFARCTREGLARSHFDFWQIDLVFGKRLPSTACTATARVTGPQDSGGAQLSPPQRRRVAALGLARVQQLVGLRLLHRLLQSQLHDLQRHGPDAKQRKAGENRERTGVAGTAVQLPAHCLRDRLRPGLPAQRCAARQDASAQLWPGRDKRRARERTAARRAKFSICPPSFPPFSHFCRELGQVD